MLKMDMNASIEQFELYSRMIQSVTTPYYQMSDAIAFEHRNPIGIVGLITPWYDNIYDLHKHFYVKIIYFTN